MSESELPGRDNEGRMGTRAPGLALTAINVIIGRHSTEALYALASL